MGTVDQLMRWHLVILGALTTLCVEECGASVEWLGGEGPPFVFVADAPGGHPGDTLRLVVQVGVRAQPGPQRTEFHITIPHGLRIIAGDTTAVFSLGKSEGPWSLLLLPLSRGSFEINGWMRSDGSERVDEAEFTMPVRVEDDTVLVEHSRYTHLESIRNGQRYRYGDWWLIPIDSTETSVVEADIEQGGAKARTVRQETAVCRSCPGEALPDTVRFVVIVDRHGRLRDMRRLGKPHDASVVEAANRALKKWRFGPAQAKGKAVADWLYIHVPVLPGR